MAGDGALPTERFGNPSEPHAAGRAARAGLDEARDSVAATLGCAPAEVVFTGGGSEADNLAVLGRLRDGGRVVASAIEHPAVREPLRAYGGEVAWAPVTADGVVDPAALAELVRPGDALCCVMAANNVTGALQPVAAIAECAERGVPLHVDAVQAASGADVRALPGRTTLALAARKLGRPEGRRRARRAGRRGPPRGRAGRRTGAGPAAGHGERGGRRGAGGGAA